MPDFADSFCIFAKQTAYAISCMQEDISMTKQTQLHGHRWVRSVHTSKVLSNLAAFIMPPDCIIRLYYSFIIFQHQGGEGGNGACNLSDRPFRLAPRTGATCCIFCPPVLPSGGSPTFLNRSVA